MADLPPSEPDDAARASDEPVRRKLAPQVDELLYEAGRRYAWMMRDEPPVPTAENFTELLGGLFSMVAGLARCVTLLADAIDRQNEPPKDR